MENFKIDCVTITSTRYKRPILKQLEDTIKFLITTDLNYKTPSDRGLHFEVYGNATSAYGGYIDLVINIIPSYIIKKKKGKLKKYIIFKTQVSGANWVEDLQKELQGILNYFGFTIMYITKEFKIIEITKEGKGYTIEYKQQWL